MDEREGLPMATRMALVEQWQSTHERLCAERWGALRDDLKWTIRLIATLVIGVLGWVAVQAWNGYQADQRAMREAHRAAAVADQR